MKLLIQRFLKNAHGATAIEYSLILALIMLALISGMGNFTNSVGVKYNLITTAFTNAR